MLNSSLIVLEGFFFSCVLMFGPGMERRLAMDDKCLAFSGSGEVVLDTVACCSFIRGWYGS